MTNVYLLALTALFAVSLAASYTVTADRISEFPIFSNQNNDSVFTYNYNAAILPGSSTAARGLLVRCQNAAGRNAGPSVIAYTRQLNLTTFDRIDESDVILEPVGDQEAFGVEDPRVVYDPQSKDYILLYSAVQAEPKVVSRLAMARSATPTIKSSWKRMGPLFPDVAWSKSGAIILRPQPPHYLIWGDDKLTLATSNDLVTFKNVRTFLEPRSDHFDSTLVESGPLPLPLSDGNLLFIYNSARPLASGGLQYNVGFLILNGTDPTQIIQRSENPILSPDLPWEKGTAPYLHLVPNVVFLEGWYAEEGSRDSFIAYYGASDSVLGAVRIKVSIA